jgi:hypothetical protein
MTTSKEREALFTACTASILGVTKKQFLNYFLAKIVACFKEVIYSSVLKVTKLIFDTFEENGMIFLDKILLCIDKLYPSLFYNINVAEAVLQTASKGNPRINLEQFTTFCFNNGIFTLRKIESWLNRLFGF